MLRPCRAHSCAILLSVDNWDVEVARVYYERTKHSYGSVRRSARTLDWTTKPSPYKEYPGIPLEPLPRELDRLLRLGAGVVLKRRGYEFRTYSSAGALYPIEVYVATADGLFHFHPRDLGLRRLRAALTSTSNPDGRLAAEARNSAAAASLNFEMQAEG